VIQGFILPRASAGFPADVRNVTALRG
jgi:hypothetical protein